MVSSPGEHSIPKAVLYYLPTSVWSAVALLTIIEKGYGEDEIDKKVVDIFKAENYAPAYLRINPNGLIPTLVVPLAKTLGTDTESRYKSVLESKNVAEFLDKSRSPLSSTNTTSAAPAPSLMPATIDGANQYKKILEVVHNEATDPSVLRQINARNDTELKVLAEKFLQLHVNRAAAADKYLSQSESGQLQASEKTKQYWRAKKERAEWFKSILSVASKSTEELSSGDKALREDFFVKAKKMINEDLKDTFFTLNEEIVGPFSLGDQISLADLHLLPLLVRATFLAGAVKGDKGDVAIAKLEKYVGTSFKKNFVVPATASEVKTTSKLAAFWDVMTLRHSFESVYSAGLH